MSFGTKIHGRVAPLSALEPKSGVPVVCLATKPTPIYRPRQVYRQVLDRRDAAPGMVAGIQTFGELINYHPHIHAIATDGVFTPDGTFLCLPRINKQLLLDVWQDKVFQLFIEEGKIDRETGDQMRRWPHSGFSVDNSVFHRFSKRLHYPRTVMFSTDLEDESHELTIRIGKDHNQQSTGSALRILEFVAN